MSRPRLPIAVLLASALLVGADDTVLPPASADDAPAGLHVSAFTTTHAARLGSDGAVDSGTGLLRLYRADTGEALVPENMRYGPDPNLWTVWVVDIDGVRVSVRTLAVPASRDGDARLRVITRLRMHNRTEAPVEIRLRAVLTPGGEPGRVRPDGALAWEPGTAYQQDGDFILRDERVAFTWGAGANPQLGLDPTPAAPDAPAATLDWSLVVEPNRLRYLELYQAGPPTTSIVAEHAWRPALKQWSYLQTEEQLSWQSDFRGQFANIVLGEEADRMQRAMVSSVHFLRSLGDAHQQLRSLSDRPYGQPASDAAAEGEILGIFAEWGLAAWSQDYFGTRLSTVLEDGAGLSPERRVALVHGLARTVRLGDDASHEQQLAAAILSLVTEEAEVAPWHDPDDVRADLLEILRRADPDVADDALPVLRWTSQPEGPVATAMQTMRRAISEDDVGAAWGAYRWLIEGTMWNGLRPMLPGGELDGTFPIGFMALTRELFLDDHGPDLHLFPAMLPESVPVRDVLRLPMMPTSFGPLRSIQQHRVAADRFGGTVLFSGTRQPRQIIMHLPDGLTGKGMSNREAGIARLLEGKQSVLCVPDPKRPQGLRFTVQLDAPWP